MKWDALWVNAKIAILDSDIDHGVYMNAAIACRDGTISWLGDMQTLPGKPEQLATAIYDAKGCWLTPGLIDCHTHLVYAGDRAQEFVERLNGKTYQEIAEAGGGIQATVTATREASHQALYAASAKRLKALLAEGVTTVEIKSGYGLDIETEMKMLQVARQLGQDFPVTIRTTFLGAHALPVEYADRRDDYIHHVCDEMLPSIASQNLADAVDVFCETIGFSYEQTRMVFEAAKKYQLPIKCHAEQLSDSNGAALAAEYHALSADHLEYINETSLQKMASAGTVAVLLPGAYYYLQEKQKPPISLLRQYNIPMALATDCNPGSAPTTSLLLMLNMGCLLFGLTPNEALAGVTRHAARALGLEKTHGSLTIGKVADFALWDIDHPIDLAYCFGYNPCVGRVVAGKPV